MGKKKGYYFDAEEEIPQKILDFLAFVLEKYASLREICVIGNKSCEEEAQNIKETRKLAKKIKKGDMKYLDVDYIMEHMSEIEEEMRSNNEFMRLYD